MSPCSPQSSAVCNTNTITHHTHTLFILYTGINYLLNMRARKKETEKTKAKADAFSFDSRRPHIHNIHAIHKSFLYVFVPVFRGIRRIREAFRCIHRAYGSGHYIFRAAFSLHIYRHYSEHFNWSKTKHAAPDSIIEFPDFLGYCLVMFLFAKCSAKSMKIQYSRSDRIVQRRRRLRLFE